MITRWKRWPCPQDPSPPIGNGGRGGRFTQQSDEWSLFLLLQQLSSHLTSQQAYVCMPRSDQCTVVHPSAVLLAESGVISGPPGKSWQCLQQNTHNAKELFFSLLSFVSSLLKEAGFPAVQVRTCALRALCWLWDTLP